MKDLKAITLRLPREKWLFLKNLAARNDVSMNVLLLNFVDLQEEKNNLTNSDGMIACDQ
jgi:hypothetical protein